MATQAPALNADLLATMTDEERAAIEDADDAEIASLTSSATAKDDSRGTPPKAEAAPATDEGTDDDDDDDAPPADEGAALAAIDPAVPPVEATPAVPVEPVVELEPEAQTGFAYRFKLPDDFDQRLEAAKAAEADQYAKFKEGEIGIEELQIGLASVAEERRALDSMRIQHDIAIGSEQQRQEDMRNAAVAKLFREAKAADAVDYSKDEAKAKDLDTFVRALAANPANEDKPLDWFLSEGHKRVKALYGLAAPQPTPTPVDPAKAKAAAAAARRQDLAQAPTTLAQVPGGDGPGDVGGDFEDVLGLEGEAFEQAIANMARTNPARFAKFQSGSQ